MFRAFNKVCKDKMVKMFPFLFLTFNFCSISQSFVLRRRKLDLLVIIKDPCIHNVVNRKLVLISGKEKKLDRAMVDEIPGLFLLWKTETQIGGLRHEMGLLIHLIWQLRNCLTSDRLSSKKPKKVIFLCFICSSGFSWYLGVFFSYCRQTCTIWQRSWLPGVIQTSSIYSMIKQKKEERRKVFIIKSLILKLFSVYSVCARPLMKITFCRGWGAENKLQYNKQRQPWAQNPFFFPWQNNFSYYQMIFEESSN